MTTPEIKSVKSNAQPSTFKRVVTTFTPGASLNYSIGEDLANGKTLKGACDEAKTDFKKVHNVAEPIREIGDWKYLLGFVPTGIVVLDNVINK